VLLGPSGCGKSTLLNCIAGLLDVSDGQIFIGGRNVTWEEPKDRGIGMVFQSYALYPQMTRERNLSFGLRTCRRHAEGRDRARVAAPPRSCRSSRCSTASRRSCPAASASASPSAGRWCATSTSSCSTSRCPTSTPSCAPSCASRSSGCTSGSATPMIYVTHDQIEALTLADRIAVMKGGVIQQLAARPSTASSPEIYERRRQARQPLRRRLHRLAVDELPAGYGFAWHNHDFEFKPLADGSRAAWTTSSTPRRTRLGNGRRLGGARRRRSAAVDRRPRTPHRRGARQGHRARRAKGSTRTAGPTSATARSTGRG
jgi:energy-coupling factor transporter ATP-binding protein EcfA2